MYVTKYCFEHRLPSGKKLLINTLTGRIDNCYDEVLNTLRQIQNKETSEICESNLNFLKHGGYVFNTKEEEDEIIDNAIKKAEASRMEMPMTFFHYITYDCNLRCTYCCYRYLDRETPVMTNDYIDKAFAAMSKIQEKEKRKTTRIVLSGGEPFMSCNRQSVEYFFTKAIEYKKKEEENDRKVILSVFTNGVEIKSFKDLLLRYADQISIIFVTLNGSKDLHDEHRITANGSGSYDAVIKGVNTLLDVGIKTWIVANVSRSNIDRMPELTRIIEEHAWNKNKYFVGCYISKVKDHRNYNPDVLSEDEMLERILNMIRTKKILPGAYNFGDMRILKSVMNFVEVAKLNAIGNPDIPEYHQFSGCNSRNSQYSFAVDGNIYCCAPAMGRKGYEIGSFSPEYHFDEIKESWWLNRNVLTIPKCKDCKVAFLCGGGCAYESAEKNGSKSNPICTRTEDVLKMYLDSLEEGVCITHKDVLYE
ncbi:uncharacterized protein LY28_01733 [Ruminiclostridium sufflavum DSM 19573]|uniref:Radical SAM core domain-containing protein n=1 Tax=Ruminiclostridium sufflavum DSM 19573 TaxID=1121337 RepID=A0A318XN09_9FIRM|nr:radical SAM protein [Ruminiclostridium sufflavum]PYG88023.1 uncharacterized protein LY28_01733 [Ruminiclostridium sufflavum DSM 19573]